MLPCNIYEEPNWPMEVMNSKGADADAEETQEVLVDIYERVDTDARDLLTHRGKTFRAAALILGLLCLLLLAAVGVLAQLYISAVLKHNTTLLSNLCQNDTCTGWAKGPSARYYKSSERKTWSLSRTDCQSRGADLVIINTREEQEFVSSLGKPGDFWIGLQSKETERGPQWTWVDNSSLQYTSWTVGANMQPGLGAKVFLGTDGHWNQTRNTSKQWICEKPMS